ncbi:hypothetical protein K438DRAFT_1931868 [Mycena galopus ATCC 62051]|nr:hypothetical protein K438DRAFT_1931868 [Mycena galopus ATCC 62051]
MPSSLPPSSSPPPRTPPPTRRRNSSPSRQEESGERVPPARHPASGNDGDDDVDESLQSLENHGYRKRKAVQPTRSVQGLGRGIRKAAALFGDISHIVFAAQEYEKNPYADDHGLDELDEDLTEAEREWLENKRSAERNYEAYLQIERLVPKLTAEVAKMTLPARLDYFTLLQKGANDARSDDIKRLSLFVGTWINEDLNHPELRVFDEFTRDDGTVVTDRRSPPVTIRDRSTRGIQHDITGALLTPTEWDWSKEAHREDLRKATKDLGATFFFRIFYEGFKGDPDKAEIGYLKSRYLVKSYKVAFTAPSSADKDDDENTPPLKKIRTAKPSRKAVADILGLNGKVTPRSIAYVAVLLYFSLTSATTWTTEYFGVSFPLLYDFIVDFFEGPAEGTRARRRADELLSWWNKKIFPAHSSASATHHSSVDSRARLRKQRAAMEDDSD